MKATAWGWVAAAGVVLAGCSGKIETEPSPAPGTTSSPGTTTSSVTVPTTAPTTSTTTPTSTMDPNVCPPNVEAIAGWQVAGATPQKYTMGVDLTTSCNGEPSLSLSSSTASDAGDFGTLMAIRNAGPYKGKRLRLSGYVKSDAVTGWAGLWMRVDGAQQAVLAFDNMEDRAIVGTTDWKAYDVVLDVSTAAIDIAYGVLLSNEGTAWLDGVSLDIVDKSVPTTG